MKLLRTFHFVSKYIHLECQWNVFLQILTIHSQYLVAMETTLLGKYSQNLKYQKEHDLRVS